MTLSNKPRPWCRISDDEKKKVIIEVDHSQVRALLAKLFPHTSKRGIECELLKSKLRIATSCSLRYLSVRDVVTTLWMAILCDQEDHPSENLC